MKNEFVGNDVLLHVDFLQDDQFVVPDAGSVFLTIRGSSGSIIPGYNRAPQPDPTINSADFIIPESVNSLADGDEFSVRYVRVDFKYLGTPLFVDKIYRLVPFYPIQVDPQTVRDKVGALFTELPDTAIEVYQSFLALKARTGFVAALETHGLPALYANEAIACKEALRLAPSLQARMFKKEEKDNAGVTRHTIDFNALLARLQGDLDKALSDMDAAVSGTVASTSVPLFLVTSPTDPVTGA